LALGAALRNVDVERRVGLHFDCIEARLAVEDIPGSRIHDVTCVYNVDEGWNIG
jgi:hypothetical protein